MTGLLKGARFRAAIGLIAAYAIALQTLFAAFAPPPASAQTGDISSWHVLCFGSGPASDAGDPDAPAPVSGKFHCVLCAQAVAAAAVLPEASTDSAPLPRVSAILFSSAPGFIPAQHSVCAGSARAPPMTA